VPLAIALTWAFLVAAQATGHASMLHGHGHGQEHGLPMWLLVLLPPFWLTVAVFLAAWLVMVAAMMLPANLPTIRRVSAAMADRPRRRLTMAAFLAGHAFAWGAFGVAAYLAVVATHTHPALVLTGVLAIAGAYQFTTLKQTCLAHRQHFDANLTPETSRRLTAVFWIGRNHGLACVGCCGPLMLLMLAVPGPPLVWMAVLTVAMLCEIAPGLARRATPAIGVGLVSAASLILAHSSLALQTLS
jgi:predicted metal-binding membrane protein